MITRVDYSLEKIDFYKQAVKSQCLDDYSQLDAKLEDDLDRAWRLCVNAIVFSGVVLVITMMEMCCGISCLPLLAHPKDYWPNFKALWKEELKAFLLAYLKFN